MFADTLTFLAELRDHNDSAWFDANRERYHAAYVEPAREFVEHVAPILGELAPGIRAEPRIVGGSIFRINRDTRFSKDKRPYKDHLDFWFWEGERKRAVSGFYARVTPDLFAVGVGAHHFDKAGLERFRSAVSEPASGRQLAQIAGELEAAGEQLGRSRYARPPRGYDADGPAARFLLYDALHVFRSEPAAVARDTNRLLSACQERWTRLAPLHRWLVDRVQATT